MSTKRIFVFGSNLGGFHGAGSARAAVEKYGAIMRQGVGLQGQSYAIPTKDEHLHTLPLDKIQPYVDDFIMYARRHPNLEFDVVRIGCGLAGYVDDEIAPMFRGSPPNVHLPEGWDKIIAIADGAYL